MRYFGYAAEDEQRFIEFTKRGLTAIFIYTNKLVHNGKREVYNPDDEGERTIAFSGDIYAPVSLFTKFLGAEYKKRCGKITLTLGTKSVSMKDDKKAGYLPAEAVCRELGFSVKLFSDKCFAVIGKAEDIKALSEDEALVLAGPYALFGEYDTSSFTDEDYERVAKKFHDKLVGTEESNDISNPNIKAKIQAIDEKCQKALEGLDRSGDPAILWGDKLR